MSEEPELTEQEKLDTLTHGTFNTPAPEKDPSAPTKKDMEKRFRISFRNGRPVFGEVKDD